MYLGCVDKGTAAFDYQNPRSRQELLPQKASKQTNKTGESDHSIYQQGSLHRTIIKKEELRPYVAHVRQPEQGMERMELS